MKEKKLEILYSGIFKVIFCCFLRIFAEWRRSHDRKSERMSIFILLSRISLLMLQTENLQIDLRNRITLINALLKEITLKKHSRKQIKLINYGYPLLISDFVQNDRTIQQPKK
jgi:hypothetical protein